MPTSPPPIRPKPNRWPGYLSMSPWKLARLCQEARTQKISSPRFTTSRSSQGWHWAVSERGRSIVPSTACVRSTPLWTISKQSLWSSGKANLSGDDHPNSNEDVRIPTAQQRRSIDATMTTTREPQPQVRQPPYGMDGSNTTVRSAFRQTSMLPPPHKL